MTKTEKIESKKQAREEVGGEPVGLAEGAKGAVDDVLDPERFIDA